MAEIIAIDGPVAVGKSTVGKMAARRMGYRFVDTGTMYRALTWKALQQKIPLNDEAALGRMSAETRFELVTSADNPGQNGILADGQDISREIRSAPVEKNVSLVSKVPEVRHSLVNHQRRLAEDGRLVMAGRDIGTVVLPEADLKIFLVASPQERARRRYQELITGGEKATYENVLSELQSRDQMDITRQVSPLKPAPDAYVLDTEGLSAEQVVDRICSLATSGSPNK
ncbi:MAG: (d)CMP kinase [Chloroflexi bacterium]|nr:(d)CMP kinase [Chloroflexota bacterium]